MSEQPEAEAEVEVSEQTGDVEVTEA